MPIKVTPATTGASVSVIKPRLSVQYINPQTEVVTQVAAADVSYIFMVVDATLDVRGLYPILRDQVVAADLTSLGYFKATADSVTAGDQLQPFVFGKAAQDSVDTAESHTLFLDALRTDQFLATEALTTSLSKPLSAQAAPSDLAALLFSPVYSDNFGTAEGGQFLGNDYVDVTYFAEEYISNTKPIFHFYKALSELIDATDDFQGVVNPDDDQTIAFTKSLLDTPLATDQFDRVVNFNRLSEELSTVSDIVANLIGKGVTDAVSLSDQQNLAIGKAATDTADASDSGSIFLSNYVDPSYFDDYAGVYQTF